MVRYGRYNVDRIETTAAHLNGTIVIADVLKEAHAVIPRKMVEAFASDTGAVVNSLFDFALDQLNATSQAALYRERFK